MALKSQQLVRWRWVALILVVSCLMQLALVAQVASAAPAPHQLQPQAAHVLVTWKLPVDGDSFLQEASPAATQPYNQELVVREQATNRLYAILRFSLAGLSAQARIHSATAHFYVTAVSGDSVRVHRVTDAWTENTVTWGNTASDYDPTPLSTLTPVLGHFAAVDLTHQVRDWVAGVQPNYGLLFIANPGSQNDIKFASREWSPAAQRPYLEVVLDMETLVDDFDPSTGFTGNDGTQAWSGDWQEVGESDGAGAGIVEVKPAAQCASGNCLELGGASASLAGKGLSRQANLNGALAARWEFSYRRASSGSGGSVAAQISADGGAAWTTLATYTLNGSDNAPVAQSLDILAYASSTTRVRFVGSGVTSGQAFFYVDDVRLVYQWGGVGDRVWQDADRDGVQDAGEEGLGGVAVQLFTGACGVAAGAPVQTSVTEPDGRYHLSVVAGGAHCVMVDETTLPAGATITSGNNPLEVTLTAGEAFMDADFGYAGAFADDRLSVGAFNPCPDIGWLQQIAATHAGVVTSADFSSCNFRVEAAPANLSAIEQDVKADAHTRHAGADVYARGSFIPNDPDYNNRALVYGPQQINAPGAWDRTLGDEDLIVAVVDTGVDLNHPEFAGRLLPGYDFVNEDAVAMDDNGHGTHVAGIVAAGIDNAIGMAGIAGRVRILPVKVLDAKNVGWWSNVARGITWAVDQGADVINLSLSGSTDAQSLRDAVAYAMSQDVLVVVAAGNDNVSALRYPASYEDVLSLGATTANGTRWTLSNYGPNVDVMAPGASIYSTHWQAAGGSTYYTTSGTSMAAPHGAGVAALLRSWNGRLSAAEVKQVILDTAVDLGTPGVDALYGYGLINAQTALASVPAGAAVPPTTEMAAHLVNDLSGNGIVDPGDTVRYRITAGNAGGAPVSNVVISDEVPPNTTYVARSTALNGIGVLDNTAPASAFPLDEGGLNIGSVPAGGEATVVFDVVVNPPSPPFYSITNQAVVQLDGASAPLAVTTPVGGAACTLALTDVLGAPVLLHHVNDTIYVALSDPDQNVAAIQVETLVIPVVNQTGGDTEMIALTETGNDTGLFRGSLPSSLAGGSASGDGVLHAGFNDTVQASYTDADFGLDTCSDALLVIGSTATETLYLSEPGQSLDRSDPAATHDTTTAQSAEISAGAVAATTFTQLAPMASNFLLPIGGPITVTAYITVTTPASTVGMAAQAPAATPRSVRWNGAAFDLVANGADNGNRWRIMQGAAAPARDEALVVGIEAVSHAVSAQRWNGSTWSAVAISGMADFGAVSEDFWWGADVAYEQLSGDALLVYNDNSLLNYSVWNGISWSAETTIATPLGGESKQIRLASKPDSDEIIAVVSAVSGDYALVWNGLTWGNSIILDSSSNSDFTNVAVAYEQQSGYALVIYETSTGDAETKYRIWNGVSWSAEATVHAPAGVTGYARWATLAVDPTSDRMILGVLTDGDSAAHTWLSVWSGSSWGAPLLVAVSSGGSYAGLYPGVAVAFESRSGQALAVYSTTFTNVLYRTWAGGAWSSEQNGPNLGAIPNSKMLVADPASDQIMLAVQDEAQDLNYVLWSGSSWQAPIELETASGETKNQPFLFLWTPNASAPSASLPASPAISAAVHANGVTVATLTNPTAVELGARRYRLRWSGTMADNATVAVGQALDLMVTTAQPSVSLAVLYDSAAHPSRVDLTTSTFVNVDALEVYDAAYPGGAVLGSQLAERAVYVRAAVSDPFGAGDITGLDLTLTPPTSCGAAQMISLGAGDVAATTAAGKVYQYRWNLPNCGGQYGVQAVAHEGSEGVTDRADTLFTVIPVADIAGRVWIDYSGDGVQNGGESGVADLEVVLSDAGGVLGTDVTGADGGYFFPGLPGGTYTVTLQGDTLPPGFNLVTTPYPLLIALVAGQGQAGARLASATQDGGEIGIKALGTTIGDVVWYDADADGVQEAGEPGLGNVTLQLFLDDGNRVFNPAMDYLVATTASNATGGYLFTAPAAGDYFVDVIDANHILAGLAHSVGPQSVTDPSPLITVAEGDVYLSVDFGYVQAPQAGTAVIGGRVWVDDDSNGVRQTGEPIIGGAEVCADLVGGGEHVCALTDLNGRYLLEAPAGAYTVGPTSNPADLLPTLETPRSVTVAVGQQLVNVDFGYTGSAGPGGAGPLLGSIGGTVWQDVPAADVVDGVYDANAEPGLAGVSLDLVRDVNSDGRWDSGEPVVAAASGSDGQYVFQGLLEGHYLVRVSDTAQVLRYFTATKPGPFPGQDGNNQAQPYAVDLAAGEDDMTADFGYRQFEVVGSGDQPQAGLIGSQVWLDHDGDGVYNVSAGDGAVPGVTVELKQNETVVAQTTTGADGCYLFTDLAPGGYTVRVTDLFGALAGYVPTRPGPNQGRDGNSQMQPYAVTLGLVPEDLTADFGYTALAALGGLTWIDTDGNGAYDAGVELPVSGVILRIVDSQDNPVDIVTSGPAGGLAPGVYRRDNLLPGAYAVEVLSAPTGFTLAGGGRQQVTLRSGEQALRLDFALNSTTSVAAATFTAQQRGAQVVLQWTTVSEQGNQGFHVYRATRSAGPYQRLTAQPVLSQSAGGAGASYRWVDATAQAGVAYWYQLVSAPNGVVIGPVAMERAGTRIYLPVLLRGR